MNILPLNIDSSQLREALIAAGAIVPRQHARTSPDFRDGHNPTSKSRIEHPNVLHMDDIGRAAAVNHLAQFRSGHGDTEHRDAFDDRPAPRGR